MPKRKAAAEVLGVRHPNGQVDYMNPRNQRQRPNHPHYGRRPLPVDEEANRVLENALRRRRLNPAEPVAPVAPPRPQNPPPRPQNPPAPANLPRQPRGARHIQHQVNEHQAAIARREFQNARNELRHVVPNDRAAPVLRADGDVLARQPGNGRRLDRVDLAALRAGAEIGNARRALQRNALGNRELMAQMQGINPAAVQNARNNLRRPRGRPPAANGGGGGGDDPINGQGQGPVNAAFSDIGNTHVHLTKRQLLKEYSKLTSEELKNHLINGDVEQEVLTEVRAILQNKLVEEQDATQKAKSLEMLSSIDDEENPLVDVEGISVNQAFQAPTKRQVKRRIKQFETSFDAPEPHNPIRDVQEKQWDYAKQHTESYKELIQDSARVDAKGLKKQKALERRIARNELGRFTRTDVFSQSSNNRNKLSEVVPSISANPTGTKLEPDSWWYGRENALSSDDLSSFFRK